MNTSTIDMNIFNFDIINIIYSNLNYIDIINFSSSNKHFFGLYKNNKKHIISNQVIIYERFINYGVDQVFPNTKLKKNHNKNNYFDDKYINNIVVFFSGVDKNISIDNILKYKNLEKLSLYINLSLDLSGLEQLKFLKTLILIPICDNNYLTNINCLNNLSNLEELDISYNSITSFEPLKKLNKLKTLKMMKSKIDDITIFSNLTLLEELHLYNCSFNKNSDFSVFNKLINLKYLDIGLTTNFDYNCVGMISNLITLYMGQNRILSLEPLNNLKKLKKLYIASLHNNIDLKPLLNMSKMEIYIARPFICDYSYYNIKLLEISSKHIIHTY
jgi:hypothetical protein